MKHNRLARVNSLLQEVIFEVIRNEVRNPQVNLFVSISRVETAADLGSAKVFVSLIGTDQEKANVLAALQSAAGFIAVQASKQVELRRFPSLIFKLDAAADRHGTIEQLLTDLAKERQSRSREES